MKHFITCSIKKYTSLILFFLMGFTPALANLPPGHLILTAGGFSAHQGSSQHIGITGLIGDHFTVSQHNDQNGLLGLGYFLDGIRNDHYNILYGLNAFYLMNTNVFGDVVQENQFTNLSYRYSITNWPVYLAEKTLIPLSDHCQLVIDLGVGPNFIQSDDFIENSTDGGITLPDNAYSGQTSVAFSATAGIGFQINDLPGLLPIEVAWRFFYLGQGYLHKDNAQLARELSTGNSYANALTVSIFLS